MTNVILMIDEVYCERTMEVQRPAPAQGDV